MKKTGLIARVVAAGVVVGVGALVVLGIVKKNKANDAEDFDENAVDEAVNKTESDVEGTKE